MNFVELERIMREKGVGTLADIARFLQTTPQAVSNWKARNQVPYHIIAKIKKQQPAEQNEPYIQGGILREKQLLSSFEDTSISISDILLTIAEQLKVIVLTTFIAVFFTFTYVQFIKTPEYVSWATVLLPDNKAGSLSGLAGLASQFGVNVPIESSADLSSPSLYPELLNSRRFAEKILDKEFYLDKYSKSLPLINILTHGDKPPTSSRDTLVTEATNILNEHYLSIDQDPKSPFSVIRVSAPEPLFAKELAEVVLSELESLNRYFKSQKVSEKTIFIENRIFSVEKDLESSEISLKEFNEQNRQISSPALELEQERFERQVEVQKGVYLTLKQQLELAKIEEVQETSVVQVLDKPEMPLHQSNKNLLVNVILAFILGASLGIGIGFIRSYLDNNDMEERKKLRRVKHFIKKKIKDLFTDRRITGTISGLMLLVSPFFLTYKSSNPEFFGLYSSRLLIINILYMTLLLFMIFMLFIQIKKDNK